MKLILTPLLLIMCIAAHSQQSNEIYFNDYMNVVPQKEAVISGTGQMENGLYTVTCHYIKRKHPMACVLHYTDATLGVHAGSYQYYYEKGGMETEGNYRNGQRDGTWKDYDQEGTISDSTVFDNGVPLLHWALYKSPYNRGDLVTVDDTRRNMFYAATIDDKGKVSIDSVAEDYHDVCFAEDVPAQFPGGPLAWTHYITRAIQQNINDLGEADYGTVLIRFFVDSTGRISDVRVLTKRGTNIATIAFNAIDKGPAWEPAVQQGKKVKVFRIQPVSLVDPDK